MKHACTCRHLPFQFIDSFYLQGNLKWFCRLLIFLFLVVVLKSLSGISLECQAVWINFMPDVLSGLIWVHIVCKGDQQMTLYIVSKKFMTTIQEN